MSDPEYTSLLAMVRRVETRQQLGELVARYGMAVDDRDFTALALMFAPDGEFHGVHGRAAIIDFYRARTASFTTSSHYAHTWHFDLLSDTEARGVVNAHAELCIDGRTVRIALRYLDAYVLADGAWMFASRRIKFRYVLPFDEVAGGTGEPMRVRWPGQPPQLADLPDQLPSYQASRRAGVTVANPLGSPAQPQA
jgi:hypothetical protein